MRREAVSYIYAINSLNRLEAVTDPFSNPFLARVVEQMAWNLVFDRRPSPSMTSKGQPTLKLSEKIDHLFMRTSKKWKRKHSLVMFQGL